MMYEASIAVQKIESAARRLQSGSYSLNVWMVLVCIQNLTLTSVKCFPVATNISLVLSFQRQIAAPDFLFKGG